MFAVIKKENVASVITAVTSSLDDARKTMLEQALKLGKLETNQNDEGTYVVLNENGVDVVKKSFVDSVDRGWIYNLVSKQLVSEIVVSFAIIPMDISCDLTHKAFEKNEQTDEKFLNYLRELLNKYDHEKDRTIQISMIIRIFENILHNKEIIKQDKYRSLRKSIKTKLNELAPHLPFAQEYKEKIFGDEH